MPGFRRVVATTDMSSSIKCVYVHFRGAFVLLVTNSGGHLKLSGVFILSE